VAFFLKASPSTAYRRGISTSGQPRAQQLAFERAAKQLQAARAIGNRMYGSREAG
jgi:hypothetical protein